MSSKGKKTATLDKSVRNRCDDASWDIPTMTVLVDLMYVQFKNGQLLSSTFSDQTWKDIAREMRDRLGVKYSVAQLKGKVNRMKILWRKFHYLITQRTGFGWSAETCTVTTPEHVWEEWLAVNPKERGLKKKGLPLYNLCTEMFANSSATGYAARASTRDASNTNDKDGMNCDDIGTSVGNVSSSHNPNANDIPSGSGGLMRSNSKKSKSNRSSHIEKALDAWASVNSAKARKYEKNLGHSVENCMAALQAMEGFPRNLFFLAQDVLVSKTRHQMFLLMSDEDRRAWVESLGSK